MTLPTLITNYKEKQTVTQLEKTYSVLSQAWQMVIHEYGQIDNWGVPMTHTTNTVSDESVYNPKAQNLTALYLRQFMNVSKTCKPNEICDPRPTFNPRGIKVSDNYTITSDSNSDSPEANFYLNDGTLLQIGSHNTKNALDIHVVLPTSKQRVWGKNMFTFRVNGEKIIPEGANNATYNKFSDTCYNEPSKNTGRGCTAWVLYNKNLDYLHCREKLGWDKASSCKD